MARRGLPSVIWSDNARTFQATQREVQQYYGPSSPKWKFILPRSPWWGGWWEILVKPVKSALKKSLGRRLLTRAELETSLHEVEACLNSRPLTFVGDEPDDIVPLTPSHFLIGRPAGLPAGLGDSHFTAVDLIARKDVLDGQLNEFWQRWSEEYVKGLPVCSGPNVQELVKVGTVVLVREDGLPRLRWPTGVIQAVFPGKDGLIRAVEVKTARGVFKRPVQRLHILEASCDLPDVPSKSQTLTESRVSYDVDSDLSVPTIDDVSGSGAGPVSNISPVKQTVTRSGRVVKPRVRFDI